MKKTTIAVLVILFALVCVSGVLVFDNDSKITARAVYQQQKLKIGYLAIGSDLSFFVALDNGYFKEQGLEVEPVKFETSNQAVNALLAGDIDGTSIMGLAVLLAVEEKHPAQFKIFEMTAAEKDTTVHRIIARKDSSISTLSDLEGKTIAAFPGLQMKVFAELVLGNHADISRINIVQLAQHLQVQALASGQVDALFTLEPVGTIAASNNISKNIAINPLYNELLRPFPTAASAFSAKFLARKPDVAESYIKAIENAHRFIRSNETEAKRSLSAYTKITPEIAPKVGIYDYWSREEIDTDAVDRLVEIYVENGIMDNKVSAGDIVLG
jgi:NitT/TauT family transport system substrate-binding protein